MNEQRIAILTDSGTDVPEEFAHRHAIFTIPLAIQFSDGLYLDGVTITPEEVYRRLPHEIPRKASCIRCRKFGMLGIQRCLSSAFQAL